MGAGSRGSREAVPGVGDGPGKAALGQLHEPSGDKEVNGIYVKKRVCTREVRLTGS